MRQFAPISVNLNNKKILVVGGGNVALMKASNINRFCSDITILANEIKSELRQYPFHFIAKDYETNDLNGYFLVYACTNNGVLNERIRTDCKQQQILCTICDNPPQSDFVSPAVCKLGDITISVGTNGKSPRQAVFIRNQIQELIKSGILKIEE